MGFFASAASTKVDANDQLLHKLKCRLCPLNKKEGLRSPKMEPTGSLKPLVYILGEEPDSLEDKESEHFVGEARRIIENCLPREIVGNQVRWNNVIRCYPGEREAKRIEIEACRTFIEEDIANTKPKIILGFGVLPLSWMGSPGKLGHWRGRRFPVKIKDHYCWFYPMLHPLDLLSWRFITSNGSSLKSDAEIAFQFDFKRAMADLANLPEAKVHTKKFARENITCIKGGDLDYVLDFLALAGSMDYPVGVDYETQNIRPFWPNSKILTKAVSIREETLAFAYDHPDAQWSTTQKEKLTKAWKRFLLSKSQKVSHSLHFECEWSVVKYGPEMAWQPRWIDTLTQAYVLDERSDNKEPLGLGFLTQQYFGFNIKTLSPDLDKNNMEKMSLDKILPYNGIDAKYHRLLEIEQRKRIKLEGLWEVYLEKEKQVPTAVMMQIKGLPVDKEQNRELAKEYDDQIEKVIEDIYSIEETETFRKMTGEKFNPASTQHIIIFLSRILKSREGQPGSGWSTTESVLKAVKHPLADAIIRYRKATKLKSTYVDPYSELGMLYPDGLLHTNLGTCFTETGRCNSENPNLQNIPRRSAEGRKVRKQLRAKPGGLIVSFDYGQIDARGIACGSRDKKYCTALWEDFDIHMDWATRIATDIPSLIGGKKFLTDKDVMKKFRSDKVKNDWVFALFYGASINTTATRFNVTPEQLYPLFKEFWNEFAGVKDFQNDILKQFDEVGYVQLFDGLRRRAPLGHGKKINSPIQGATQRIIMNGANKLSSLENPILQPNLQIHDELLYFFDTEKQFEESLDTIVDCMLDQSVFDWICVPIIVEMKMSRTDWSEMKDVEVFRSNTRLNWPIRPKEFS